MSRIVFTLLGMLLGGLLVAAVYTPWSSEPSPMPAPAANDLDSSWADFIDGLNRAQHSLTDPRAFPAPATDRNLAEGHRYMLGHINRMIEMEMRQDPRFPEFGRSMDMLRKWTGENPDAMYLKAPIDATGYYMVVGFASDVSEWGSSARGLETAKAPRMVTFQTITDVPGGTGDLAEMASCKNQTLDYLNSFELEVGGLNNFEILIGPERPPGHTGNFLLSQKLMACAVDATEELRQAQFLSVREIFSDWTYEQPLDMEILRLDAIGESRPPIDSAFVASKLRKIGTELPNQILFWQKLQALALEVNADVNGDGRRNMPVNGINQPAAPFTAGGVAGAQQLYAAGVFELESEQALIVKVTAPVEPHYIGFQLNNLWFEGPDQQNYTSSLTGAQLPVASDGSRYYIVAHRDPGVQGWVDTTGLEKGTHAMRFVFREQPSAEGMPIAEARLVDFSDIASHLPADTPQVSPDQRRSEIAVRQSHIKARWRGH
ncbi:hypothetical protein EYC98_17050 [Halieaceae bacterium IMCC14734]|uniref:DUF1214 domain-containing protein n=1 Tax=Candidatus Litorirhabdus singularis TaxID=2518993 RepID=A0ABT3TJT1_9GAMM|nr:hypothetical protein [Candidatus Litorirhabdus singularis]MCX2982573.1 hypothetical protein [Candidatus Litorirhabdus singularis]